MGFSPIVMKGIMKDFKGGEYVVEVLKNPEADILTDFKKCFVIWVSSEREREKRRRLFVRNC